MMYTYNITVYVLYIVTVTCLIFDRKYLVEVVAARLPFVAETKAERIFAWMPCIRSQLSPKGEARLPTANDVDEHDAPTPFDEPLTEVDVGKGTT